MRKIILVNNNLNEEILNLLTDSFAKSVKLIRVNMTGVEVPYSNLDGIIKLIAIDSSAKSVKLNRVNMTGVEIARSYLSEICHQSQSYRSQRKCIMK